jgi:hypothetical protein
MSSEQLPLPFVASPLESPDAELSSRGNRPKPDRHKVLGVERKPAEREGAVMHPEQRIKSA